MKNLVFAALFAIVAPSTADAAVIRVPADVSTIQGAIDIAQNGDMIVVSPGIYYERINFVGKAITVTSEQGPEVTIIDAQRSGTVVTFRSREGRDSVLSGFTIRGGYNISIGAGIQIGSSSPIVRGNTVTDNIGCNGVGINTSFASPRIEANKIIRNAVQGYTGCWGIGVRIGGDSSAELIDNDIAENTSPGSSFGGGVALFAAGAAFLRGNVIRGNNTVGPSGCGEGGGLITANYSNATLVDNLIIGNIACFAGGIAWGGGLAPNIWVNNTVADNEAIYYPGVHVSGFDARNELHNNSFSAKSGPAFVCENAAGVSSPVMVSNNIFNAQGSAWAGSCPDPVGLNGNISADPLFVDSAHGDYRLQMNSALVDAGNDAAPKLPLTDLAGSPRIIDGNGDAIAHVDLGAFEYANHAPVADAGSDQTFIVTSDCRARVTLNGTGSDLDGDSLTYEWSGATGRSPGQTLSVSLPPGSYVFTLTVRDGNGGFATDAVVVTVIDNGPPAIQSVTATPSVITQANHEMVSVVVSVSVSDCDPAVSCRIVSVTSNEPEQGIGDGDTSPDWEITGNLMLNVRAERAGNGPGRVYTITIACRDAAGNVTTSNVTVIVPHNF